MSNVPTRDGKAPLRISYNRATDILTIEGMQYSGEMFRLFSIGTGHNELAKILSMGGIVYLQTVRDAELSRRFDELGLGV